MFDVFTGAVRWSRGYLQLEIHLVFDLVAVEEFWLPAIKVKAVSANPKKLALISASLPEFITEIHLPTRFSSRNVAYRSNPRKWFSNTIKKKFDYHSGYNEHCNMKFHSQNFNAY